MRDAKNILEGIFFYADLTQFKNKAENCGDYNTAKDCLKDTYIKGIEKKKILSFLADKNDNFKTLYRNVTMFNKLIKQVESITISHNEFDTELNFFFITVKCTLHHITTSTGSSYKFTIPNN